MELLERPEPFVGGIDFGEGPRWHDGRLWFSDFYQHAVKAASLDGTVEVVLEFEGQPSGLGWPGLFRLHVGGRGRTHAVPGDSTRLPS